MEQGGKKKKSESDGEKSAAYRLKWNIQNGILKVRGDPTWIGDREMNNHTEKFNVFICVAELKSDLNMNQSYREESMIFVNRIFTRFYAYGYGYVNETEQNTRKIPREHQQ